MTSAFFDPMNPKVIDLYHDDNLPVVQHDFQQVFDAGYRGVIHKATEGSTMVDSQFRAREIAARAAGLMWGWYHYLDGTDPARQAEFFYTTIGGATRGPGILALDFEEATVPLSAGLRWLELVEQLSGQIPWLYMGGGVPGSRPPAFARYPLWLPEYNTVAHVPQPWTKYTLWQFTNTGAVPGVTGLVDLSHFDGTDDELRTLWLGAADTATDPSGYPDPWEGNHDPGVLESSEPVRIDDGSELGNDTLSSDRGPEPGDHG
jgi:lysozyme